MILDKAAGLPGDVSTQLSITFQEIKPQLSQRRPCLYSFHNHSTTMELLI